MQPIVSDDVAAALADVAIAEPLNDTVELAGPEPVRMDEQIRRFLSAKGDSRRVITDTEALYYGVKVNDQSLYSWRSLAPGADAFRRVAQEVGLTKQKACLKDRLRTDQIPHIDAAIAVRTAS